MMDEVGEENDKVRVGFAKHLASCNKKTRDTAVELLRRWLEAQTHVSDIDFKKIWKGLFYCVWHADKHEVQAQLIDKLASLIRTLDLALAQHYFQVFLLTMVREWSGIDHLRLDKFYLMLTRFLHHVFLRLDDHGWGSELTKGFMADLRDGTLLAQVKYPSKGVSFHFVDVYLNELADFLPLRVETFGLVLEPLYSVLAKSPDKVLVSRVRDNVFDCLLESGKKLIKRRQEQRQGHDVDIDDDDKVEKFGSIAVTMGIANGLFELATAESTLQVNRKVIYALHEDFGKLEKYFSATDMSVFPNGVKKRKLSAEEPAVAGGDANQQIDDKMEIIEEGSLDKSGKRIKEAKKSKLEKVREKGKSKKAKNLAESEDGTSAIKKKAKKLAASEDGTSAIKKKAIKLAASEDGTSAIKKKAKKLVASEDGTSAIKKKAKKIASTEDGTNAIKKKTKKEYCTEDEVKEAFRAKVKEFHPDVYKGPGDANSIVQRVIKAYEFLVKRISQGEYIQRSSSDPFEEPDCEALDIFVNELLCIGKGCQYSCVKRAPRVFSYALDTRCARAIAQGQGEDYQVQLAVGQCPRNCIYYVTPAQRIILEELLARVLESNDYLTEASILESLIARANFENNRYQGHPKRNAKESTKWVDWY